MNPKKVMNKVREQKMFNMMAMGCLNLLMRKTIMLMLFHLSQLFTKQWKLNKEYMSPWMWKVVICQITQILRTQQSFPLFSITRHHHCSLKMQKTFVMPFQVTGPHRGTLILETQVESSWLVKFLIQKQIYNMLRSCTLLVHTKSTLLFCQLQSCQS